MNSVEHGVGGGLSVGGQNSTATRSVTLDNCIFWNNAVSTTSGVGSQLSLNGTYPGVATANYCDIQDSDTSEPGIYVETGWTAPTLTACVDVDPDFVADPNPGSNGWGNGDDDYGDLGLASTSTIINRGSCTLVPLDQGDVNDDQDFDEPLPWDLAEASRRIDRVEMGAYEYQDPMHPCLGDINNDEDIEVADLLAVIIGWGACPAHPTTCPADIAPQPCTDGTIGVADLLAVISHWGECTSYIGMPESVGDCMDACAPLGIGTSAYSQCLERCIQSLEE